jgi:hypothetical protein
MKMIGYQAVAIDRFLKKQMFYLVDEFGRF